MTDEKKTYEADRVLDHDYDGIQEYDNRLPNWWLWTLWGASVFSVGYWFLFHTYGVYKNPVAKYEAELAASAGAGEAEMSGPTEAELVAMSSDPGILASGQEVCSQVEEPLVRSRAGSRVVQAFAGR